MSVDVRAIAERLLAAYDSATQLAPITASDPSFDVATGETWTSDHGALDLRGVTLAFA